MSFAGNEEVGITAQDRRELLRDHSIEVTCRDLPQIRASRGIIPSGTRVNVTALGRESFDDRVAAVRQLIELGLTPVPHLAARRVSSSTQLLAFLAGLAGVGAVDEVFVVGGDVSEPEGPYTDSLRLIESGALARAGVQRVGVAVYPEGHPSIDDRVLERDLSDKLRALSAQGIEAYAISQFCFNSAAVVDFAKSTAAEAGLSELRIGVPGPTTAARLMRYASQFGVRSSSNIVRKYGFSLTNLMSTAKPGRFVDDLARELASVPELSARLHFYPFGAVGDTVRWIDELAPAGGRP